MFQTGERHVCGDVFSVGNRLHSESVYKRNAFDTRVVTRSKIIAKVEMPGTKFSPEPYPDLFYLCCPALKITP